jgi:hypothetical protein
MDSQILMRLNEIYRHDVYNEEVLSEETLSEDELVDINGWVSQLISEGYNLDDYSDEELYAAYLSAFDEAKKYESQVLLKGVPSELHKMVKQASRSQRNKSTPTTFRQRIIRDKTSKYRQDDSMPEPRASARGPESPTHLEELDLYDIVSEYLVTEGFCDSYEDADVIMANMSEEWRESIMEEVLDEANRPEQEMIKKGLLKPGRQVARIRNLNRQSGNTNWYAADPRDSRAIKSPGKGGVFNSRQRQEQEADAFNTSRRRREHEFDQDSSRARKTGDWSKVDKKRPLGGHKTRFEKERDERNNRTVYGD